LLTIELQNLQTETEYLKDRHQLRMETLTDSHRQRMNEQGKELETYRRKVDTDFETKKAEQEAMIEALKVAVRESEGRLRTKESRREDLEHIDRMEALRRERRDALEQLVGDFGKYETSMIDIMALFSRLTSPSFVARTDTILSLLGSMNSKKNLRKDRSSILPNPANRFSAVLETLHKKNRTPV
jgi:hypothetical protein